MTNTKAGRLRAWALEALRRHEADDTLPTSPRHLFYEAVMAGVTPKHAVGKRRADQDLTDAVTWLRERGHVPWDAVEDRTRHLHDFRGLGATMLDAVDAVLDGLPLDPWGDVLPVLVVESESVAGVLARLAHTYRVPIVPTRGQTNGWLRTTVARELGGRSIAVAYLGDADKAGGDIEENTRRVLTEVLVVKQWERVALTWEQVEALGLPTLDRVDGRNKVTYEVCEVEALPQRTLTDAVEHFLSIWLPAGVDLGTVRVREQAERGEIRRRLGLAP